MSFERLLNDHLGQQRWRNHRRMSTQMASRVDPAETLIADADEIAMSCSQRRTNEWNNLHNPSSCCCEKENRFSLWLGALGEFAKAKPEHQTPDFSTASGGVIAAGDYRGIYPHPIGSGIAYAHSHIEEKEDAGYANIDQGDLFFYGTFPVANWYFDTAIWGGYYHAKNVREISFTGFLGGKATCKVHGWQFSPHLEVGYDLWMNWFTLEPFTMIDYVGCWEHSANESGATPLNFGQRGRYCSLLRSEAGLRFQEVLSLCWGTVTFMEKGGYAYQKAFHTGRINAFLIGSPGSFTYDRTYIGAKYRRW